jgi:kumamolisin
VQTLPFKGVWYRYQIPVCGTKDSAKELHVRDPLTGREIYGGFMAVSTRFAEQKRISLAGSEKQALAPEEIPEGKVSAARGTFTVSVLLKRKAPIAMKRGRPQERLTRAAFAQKHGANAESLKMVKAFAKEFGLKVETEKKPGPRTVQLTGPAGAMQKAFGVKLKQHGLLRLREGSICLPEELEGHVEAVLGLDNRPQATPHFRVHKKSQPQAASGTSYTPVQVGQLYGFPAGATATGQTIGIIELGGGYRAADLTAYFKTLGLPAPKVTTVSVDKGKNTPGTASGADGEVMLDIEVCASVATGAAIAVYFAPNTNQGFIDAITTAVHDTTNKPSVISISWGGPESTWTAQSLTALDQACQAAATIGVTITVACGDNGSTDGVKGTANHVDFPASSPHVLACGGTKLVGSGTTITSEVVWNELASNEGATGGGVSNVFALPTWQANAGVPKPTVAAGGRGVPDVCGDADPTTGYTIRVDSETLVIGGTSAVAPLWAGLIALANAQNKVAAGFINPVIYAAAAKKAFRDITSGTNGGFSAGPGWDACTGLGSPVGTAVIAALKPATGGTTKKGKK